MKKPFFLGLAIAREPELCEKYMGKFPVISITLKGADARNYADRLWEDGMAAIFKYGIACRKKSCMVRMG